MEEKKDIKPIDFTSIVKKLWPHRKKYYYVLPITLIATYLIIICIPRYYKCTVRLAPEISGVNVSGSLSSLASSFGLGSSLAKMNSQDAISSEIYPDVIQSKNFIAELMTVNIQTQDGETKCSYYQYLRDKQKDAWWNIVMDTIKGWFKSSQKDDYTGAEKLDVFGLTKKQSDVFKSAQGKLDCTIDKKTEIVSIEVKDQDPLVCATMADSTCQKLQQFITDYRTNKARIDYEYYQKLCKESEEEYNKVMHRYASFSDSYHKPVLASYSTKETTLENEMQSSYTLYQGIKAQMQAAQAKLQEATPAFTVIESASVPTKPAGPKRMIISILMMVLSFFVLSGWLLVKEEGRGKKED
jgi:hypothetical protein